MSIRFKLLAVFFGLGIVPLLAVSIINHVSGVRAAERMLREDLDASAGRIANKVEKRLRTREANLTSLAGSQVLRDYVRGASQPRAAVSGVNGASVIDASARGEGASLPESVREKVGNFFVSQQNYYESITCLGADRRPLFRVQDVVTTGEGASARFETEDVATSNLRVNESVWSTVSPAPLLAGITPEQYGACAHFTLPVFLDEGNAARRGALVVELKIDALFEEFDEGRASYDEGRASYNASATGANAVRLSSSPPSRVVVALDRAEQIIYHTSRERTNQTVEAAMPFFKPVAGRMTANAGGMEFYEMADGTRWLAAYQPVNAMGLSVAVAENYTEAVGGLRRNGIMGIVLASLAALAATGLLLSLLRHTARRIENVATAAAAVARGDLNQHIDADATDETQGLAESFNLMTDRLREHITREAETRQFESFLRLSATLTHDLKNAITGLSMLVQNFENHLHKEEFRADAIQSLRDSTDKLRRIVARLTEPMKSLSGEYRRDLHATDLVPMIRRVLAVNAEPSVPLYQIETHLPESLVIPVEPERIENVVENLVLNAIEAMGTRGGRLTVEAGEAEEGRIFFSVADTGVGMEEDFIKLRLFRAFATTKTKGIGLGLFTCREIVEAHGGRLEVKSQVGVGTRFRVVLPSTPFTLRSSKEQSQKRASAGSSGGERNV